MCPLDVLRDVIQPFPTFSELFGAPGRQGVVMAIDALGAGVDADQVRALAPAYTIALQRVTVR